MPLLADYAEERDLFNSLLQDPCEKRILLFEGQSGTGKTSLLADCSNQAPANFHRVNIQLRQNAVGVSEIFYRLGDTLNWAHLPTFTEQVANMQNAPSVTIDGNWLVGMNNHINVALQAESPTDREHRMAGLTSSCFADLAELSQPLLIVLDTYENAVTQVADWLAGPFLARASRTPTLRVLLAGQRIPDPNNIEWGHCCQRRELHGIPDAEHWLPVVEALNRQIHAPDSLSWLAGICHALEGRPYDIMQIIEALPRKGARQ